MGRLAGGGDIYDGYCSQCGDLEGRVKKLEQTLAEERRAQFIGPIEEKPISRDFSNDRPIFARVMSSAK